MSEQITFHLPLGLEVEEKIYKTGKMHLTTTLDELNVQEAEETAFNSRYRDILLLSSVIDEIGDITDVTKETIMNLFEADFLYLQLLYNQLNGENKPVSAKCENCETNFSISLSNLYADNAKVN